MTFPLPVQRLCATGLSGTGKTFGASDGWSTPAAGNMILALVASAERRANLTVPSGWGVIEQSAPNCPMVGVLAKVSDGTESSVLVELDEDDEWIAILVEFDGQDMEVEQSKFGSGQTDGGTDSLSSSTSSAVEGFSIALFASMAHNDENPTFTNDFWKWESVQSGGPSNLSLDVAASDANEDSSGTYETTAAWASSSARTSLCPAVNVTYLDGEKLRAQQRLDAYKVVHAVTQEILARGLNRGQARKLIGEQSGPYNLKVDD